MRFLSKDGACIWSELDEAYDRACGRVELLALRLALQLDSATLRRLGLWVAARSAPCPADYDAESVGPPL
jgi:hypothetical protein